MRGTDFLLGGNAEEGDGSFFCIPAIRTAGKMKNERGKSQYKRDNELADDAPDEGKELPDRNPKELKR